MISQALEQAKSVTLIGHMMIANKDFTNLTKNDITDAADDDVDANLFSVIPIDYEEVQKLHDIELKA